MWNIKKVVSNGDYNRAVVPDHPHANENDYVLHHRVVVENDAGRVLDPENEVVHHINGDTKDNRIENLEVLTREEHGRLHGKEQTATYIKLKCPECGERFEKQVSDTHISNGNRGTFCSRTCSASFSNRPHDEQEKRLKGNVIERVER